MLMVGFQSPGIILWSRHSIGGLSCLGGGLRSLRALVYFVENLSTLVGNSISDKSTDKQPLWKRKGRCGLVLK